MATNYVHNKYNSSLHPLKTSLHYHVKQKFLISGICSTNSWWQRCAKPLWWLCKLLTDLKNTFYEFGTLLHCFN